MTNNTVITSDNPLNNTQQKNLIALLDVLIPASDDELMPSAAGLDFIPYLHLHSAETIPILLQLLDHLEPQFCTLSPALRQPIVEQLSNTQAAQFRTIVMQVFACYYQTEAAQKGIGLEAGAPFPRGNDIEAGDLSLIDPVIAGDHGYRKA